MSANRAAAPRREEGEERDFAPMVPAETFAPTEPPVIHPEDTPAGRAQKFLMDVTDRMGVKVDVYVDESKADNLSIHMIGDTLGILIGRRGETLDALQYLTSLQVTRAARAISASRWIPKTTAPSAKTVCAAWRSAWPTARLRPGARLCSNR